MVNHGGRGGRVSRRLEPRFADTVGLETATLAYQWVSREGCTDTDIQGATNSSYTLADADAGKTIKVQGKFTDDEGTEETLTSAVTDTVAARSDPLTASFSDARTSTRAPSSPSG